MDYLEKLIQLREEKGLTQNDLTEIYGCNQSNISKIERKERKLDIEQLIALCRFYKRLRRLHSRSLRFYRYTKINSHNIQLQLRR